MLYNKCQTFGLKEADITDTNRFKQAMEWFYNTVFQDEAIQPRPQASREPPPALIRAARSLENGTAAYRQSREAIFIKQAKVLANYEDDYVYDEPVQHYYPTYQSLTDPELRGYFSWRTKLRRGELRKTSLTYAFVYIYELLNQIGVSDPADGYRKLEAFENAYGRLDGRVVPYLSKWRRDYVVYYDLDPALLADWVSFDKRLAVLANLQSRGAGQIMEAVNFLAPRALTRSRFYKEYRQDVDTVVPRVLRRVSEHCGKRCKRTMVEQYFGPYGEFPATLFESAVFYNRAKGCDREFAVDELRTYRRRNGVWYVEKYDCPERPSAKLTDLVKTVDSVMRECYAYRHPVKRALDTQWLLKLMEEEARRFLAEKEAARARKIAIDYSRLAKIRRDAAVTRDRLIVEEEAPEAAPEPAPETPEDEAAGTPLSREEYRLLQCLLYGRDYGWVRASGLMLSVLADGINEKLFDQFADSVLTLDGRPELVEDYIQDLKEMVRP